MSSIGSPIDNSILQAAQAQQVAGKARAREKAITEKRIRHDDLVELRVKGVETSEAVRKLPQNDSGQGEAEHDAKHQRPRSSEDDDREHVDIQA